MTAETSNARGDLLRPKLENIISGHRINADDADWLRAMLAAAPPPAAARGDVRGLVALAKRVQYADTHAQVSKDDAGEFVCLPPWMWLEIRDAAAEALAAEGVQAGEVEAVGEVIDQFRPGALHSYRAVKWAGAAPTAGTKLYTAPPSAPVGVEWTDERIIAVCKAAGVRWIEADEEEGGFPGGFDITHMPEMRRLFTALAQQPAAVDEVVRAAVLAEREACARACDDRAAYYHAGDDDGPVTRRGIACEACASVIRWRSTVSPKFLAKRADGSCPDQQPAAVDEKYSELIYAVSRKYPGESRHETALRYIRQAESAAHGPAQTDTQHQEPTT